MFLKNISEIQTVVALLLASSLQFLISGKKGLKAMLIVTISALFLGMYIISPLLNEISTFSIMGFSEVNLKYGSAVNRAVTSISGLISAELISMIIVIMPGKIKNIILQKLELDNNDNGKT